jgi:proteasome lid subunit RPN8/RPN11
LVWDRMSWHRYQVHSFYHVLRGIFSECQKHTPNETIGFLVGMYCRWEDEYYTLVDGYIPVGGTSSEYHVIMDAKSVESAIQILEKQYNDGKHSIVGWYHSHPGYGVFLSDIDVKSQITFFNQPHHVALVVDPVRNKFGFFKLSLYNEPVPVSYAIWREVSER